MKNNKIIFNEEQKFLTKINFLESKQRELVLNLDSLIKKLPIDKNHVILDLGAGTGFFTLPLANISENRVLAVDSDVRMINFIKRRAIEKGINNIEFINEYIESINLDKKSVDFIIASLILHEVTSWENTIEVLQGLLKSNGYLFCVEYEKDEEIKIGPPMHIRINSDKLKEKLVEAGFEILEKKLIDNGIYTILAKKK